MRHSRNNNLDNTMQPNINKKSKKYLNKKSYHYSKGVQKLTKKATLAITALLLITIIYQSAESTQVTGNNSIYTFTVQNCTANQTLVGCEQETIKFQCNITPETVIDSVEFYIDGTPYPTTQNNSNWFYDYQKPQDTSTTTTPITLEKQKIFDVNAGYVFAFETTSVARNCTVCSTTYNVTCTPCTTQNTQNCTYTPNDPCGTQYNTTNQYCDYCTPNWVARTGGIYDCQQNGTKFVFYDDFNNCYAQTSLPEDAPPPDHNTTQVCNYFKGDFNCTADKEPYLTKKINVFCELPQSVSQLNWKCLTYVKKDLNSTILLQTNPEYKNKPTSILGIGEIETRTHFTNDGRIVNAYYTNKLLEAGNTFILGVKCSTNQTVLAWEQQIKPTYRNLNVVTGRFVWAKENMGFLVAGFLLAVLVLSGIAYLASILVGGLKAR